MAGRNCIWPSIKHACQDDIPPSAYVTLRYSMPFEYEKTMFEVYRETTYTSRFRVVYFTELQDHNKEAEINRAMAGEHFLDGFIKDLHKDEAKAIIDGLLNRMNGGEAMRPEEFLAALGEHLA